ncbi:MAG TPA: type II secretion system protein GspL [Ramlibacter sp.]|jgi:general secretion pathway protein L|uniref:type II secretion system protein GspL n=1 Tax=Ramlibacter sp. TaxID=1917967 RepID=UPI002D70259C|nr:type II secretion system protein GspL [Ramlibacter sp.]HZY19704.1 type II secretion system protein GspL [Ramlibacter sp.]
MSSLFVLLPASPATAQTEFHHLVSPDGRSVTTQASTVAALLPAPAGAGSELVAIAPAEALSWHKVELPKGTTARSPRLRAILEGLLEDRLLDDPDHVHFALQPRAVAEAPAWVAVCDRAWLRSCLQVLEAAGRPAARVVPEFAPEGDAVLYALGEPADARLVCAGAEGIYALPLAASSLPLLPSLPEATPIVAEPAVAALAEQVLQHAPQLQAPGDRLLLSARTAWDLAQFEFASSGRTRAFKKLSDGWAGALREPQWRAARWAAIVLVVVQLVGLNAWAWRERSALAAKREGVRSVLTQTFPNVRAVVDAPVQMEREVAALRQSTGAASGRDLETMLGALATAAPGARATGLEFNGAELRVRGLGPDAQVQPIAQSLRSQGFGAKAQGDVLVIRAEGQP